MMKPKILKTPEDYDAALAYIETLMDAEPGSPEEDELELFAILIEQYEEKHFPIGLPDPIEAIKFRMEQEELSRKDLVPYIGSLSKVSEVLNRKRPLSLNMIRRLHEGLGIPAEVLLQEAGKEKIDAPQYDIRNFPFSELFKRGYFNFNGTLHQAREYGEELLAQLFAIFGGQTPQMALYRRSDKPVDQNALLAWQAQALHLAMQDDLPAYDPAALTESFVRDLAKTSYFEAGPKLAKELLNSYGVHVIVLPHLPKTYLDGACFMSSEGRPVIGLTLRHDRLDNFWFTLLHELAHVHLHLHDASLAFFDDTEAGQPESDDPREREANDIVRGMLISPEAWESAGAELLATRYDDPLRAFARDSRIHPAIVAGRVRWELGDYTLHSKLLGSKKVREQFDEFRA
ncbi:MAG: ImmA/IrrE family metallo-endopeptidase [Halieaceae bacterium]|nr:ImmA/IrrE family metallo-endopeptidase [Halieaceae bacterium]